MLVLNLCKQFCPEKILVQLGERLEDGADGEVFVIANEPNKVIKFSIIYDRLEDSPKCIYFNQVVPVLDYVMLKSPSMYVRVYEHGLLGEFSRQISSWRNGVQHFVIHYHIMEKLLKLSEDEKKVFHSLISHEDRKIEKDLSTEKIKKNVKGLSRGLDFNAEKVILFCDQLREASLLHLDMHFRNIMKDVNGFYKFIDLDRCNILYK